MISEEEKRKRAELEAKRKRLVEWKRRHQERADNQEPSGFENEEELVEHMGREVALNFPFKTRGPAEVKELDDLLDDVSNDVQVRHDAWTRAVAKWEIAKEHIDFEDYDSSHPFVVDFYEGGTPDDWSRKRARTEHRIWLRRQGTARAERQRRRVAFHSKQGLDEEDLELLDALNEEELQADVQAAIDLEKADRPYLEGARLILQAWRDNGAKIRGVPIDLSKLRATSKAVKWFKAKTEGKAVKHVNETAKRLAAKSNWHRDFKSFQDFKVSK